MSYSPAQRYRAQELFAAGWSIDRLRDELKIPRSTLLRWSKKFTWSEQRRLQEQLRSQTLALVARLTEAASESADPQQVFAVAHAARLLPKPPDVLDHKPIKVVEVMLDVLAQHPEVGPVVRRHRGEVLRLVMRELERLDPEASVGATA